MMLKAFSAFKKRQKSSVIFIIISDELYTNAAVRKALDSYKYKDDIMLLPSLLKEEDIAVVRSAYAFISPHYFGFGVQGELEAMHSGVPVLAFKNSILSDYPVISYMENSYESLALSMLKIYKDESLRAETGKQALEQIKNYSIGQSEAQLWHIMNEAYSAESIKQ